MKKNPFWLVSLVVFLLACSSETPTYLVDHVNPLMGTDSTPDFSHGNVYPATGVPFGMTQWTPQTGEWGWIYQYNKTEFQGLRATHQPSPWIGDYAQFSFMPFLSEVVFDDEARAESFKHENEDSKPYYYRLQLDNGIQCEMSGVSRSASLRFQFPESGGSLLFDASQSPASLTYDESRYELSGYNTINSGGVPANFAGYFVVQFDQEISAVGIIDETQLAKGEMERKGDHIGFVFTNPTGKEINVRVGTSFISISQARANLSSEIGDLTLEEVSAISRNKWEAELAKVLVETDNIDYLKTFYSSLYRTLIFPREFHEFDQGEAIHYSPYHGKIDQGVMYVDNGFWDTFRGQFPLLSILNSTRSGEMMEGFVNSYKEGDWLPKWTSPGYRNSMISTHSASLIADAYLKGVRNFDYDAGYEAMVKDAISPSPFGGVGREGIDYFMELGYVPTDKVHEATARTLEFAYDDFCIGKMAEALNKPRDAAYFFNRSFNYANVFDKQSGFMRGRNADGSWKENFSPIEWGGPFTEGSAWHYSWSVLHDPAGLIKLMGGKEDFGKKMDSVFTTPPDFGIGGYGREIHEMTEMVAGNMGQYAHGNQPVHHFVYLYNYIDEAWKTQFHVREILTKLYKAEPQGYCGDEDNGQMSAWYVLSSMGFYQVAPGHDQFILGSPLFDKVTINHDDGNRLEIIANGNKSDSPYWDQVSLNGQVLDRTWITYDEIMRGGILEFRMRDSPSKEVKSATLPVSLSDYYSFKSTDYRPSVRPTVPKPEFNFTASHFKEPFMGSITVNEPGVSIYYTLDGSLPDQESTRYEGEFLVDNSRTIKAIGIKEGFYKSPVNEKKVVLVNSSYDVFVKNSPSPNYTGGSPLALIDKEFGPRNYFHPSWMGFNEVDLETDIDLGGTKLISEVIPNFLEQQGAWILYPKRITLWISEDGVDYEEMGSLEHEVRQNDGGLTIRGFPFKFGPVNARFIRIKAENVGKLPSWHPSSGGGAYMFIDEISIK